MATTRGRPRNFDRDQALETALTLFWERGYDAVGIKDLTKALGISDSSLYAAFGSKAGLFAEVVQEYTRRYGGYITEADQQPTAALTVSQLLRSAVHQQTLPKRPHGCLIISGATNHRPQSKAIADDLHRRRDAIRDMVAAKVEADIATGELPEDVRPSALAHYVLAVWEGAAQLARDGASRHDLLQVVTTALRAWPPSARGSHLASEAISL